MRIGTPAGIQAVPGQTLVAWGTERVENHPLFHFFPGAKTLSLGFVGCSATCIFCQNWELSQAPRVAEGWHALPLFSSFDQIIEKAKQAGCQAVSFTYNEPIVWIEAVLEIAAMAKAAGLLVILATNGFMTQHCLDHLAPLLDAVKVDLKGDSEEYYRGVTGMALRPILKTLERLSEHGIWHEVSTVLVPALEEPRRIRGLAQLVVEHSGRSTPWHLMRFFPAYKLISSMPGDLSRLETWQRVAFDQGLDYVYISNVPNIVGTQTLCPMCTRLLSTRRLDSFQPLTSQCPRCGYYIPGKGLLQEE